MLVTGGGVAVGVVVGRVVVGRVVLGWVEAGCVLGSLLGGDVDGGAAEGAGAVLGSAQLGGLAGTVGMLLAGLAVGELVFGNGEDCAAGEVEAPEAIVGWPPGWAVVFPGCPVRAVTAA